MASKPNPSWTEPQKRVHKEVLEGLELLIPYFGAEIPVLDNHTTEQMCDELGVVKAGLKAFETVEKVIKERFKARLGGLKEMRGTRYEATVRDSERTALNQGKVGLLLGAADSIGLDLNRLLSKIEQGEFEVPADLALEKYVSNEEAFFNTTPVATLTVKAL